MLNRAVDVACPYLDVKNRVTDYMMGELGKEIKDLPIQDVVQACIDKAEKCSHLLNAIDLRIGDMLDAGRNDLVIAYECESIVIKLNSMC